MEPTFHHEPDARMFVADVGGVQGTVSYVPVDHRTLDFQSTYVPHALRGQRVGTLLVRYALSWAREHDMRVVPSCWFVAMVMDKEPVWRDVRAER
jgi:predicted GNAT family acetyltransferase